jgi:hypothetical protein
MSFRNTENPAKCKIIFSVTNAGQTVVVYFHAFTMGKLDAGMKIVKVSNIIKGIDLNNVNMSSHISHHE